MKLAALRRLSIREQAKIHFRLSNGMECVVNEQGIAQVPGLRSRPAFNLEEELAAAGEFLIEPAAPRPSRKLLRSEIESLAEAAPAAAAAHDHEDE
ncbi:MAG TPA: hypothetical protein VKX45_13640 [Bryobacteraceae bacterium]|jgi:hypothetical protein|nr:hypothetical protein [Bryobacteraceae bacterium]